MEREKRKKITIFKSYGGSIEVDEKDYEGVMVALKSNLLLYWGTYYPRKLENPNHK